jgi:hypothetical protein
MRTQALLQLILGMFSNANDGIQQFDVPIVRASPQGSVLRSAQNAPRDGYEREYRFLLRVDPQLDRRSNVDVRNDVNFYFRVRSHQSKDGEITSAWYGKIYNDFRCWCGDDAEQIIVKFTYYVNPKGQNLEYSPGLNLFRTGYRGRGLPGRHPSL